MEPTNNEENKVAMKEIQPTSEAETKAADDPSSEWKAPKVSDEDKEELKASSTPFQAKNVIDEKTNFTWEHFFTKHCGILPEDARMYEASLISHRMSPIDTLLESLSLIIEYGRIPIGDKLKITKSIQRAQEAMESRTEALKKAKKKLGLDGYNDLVAKVIMDLAGGDTEHHIEWGIEQWEDFSQELERSVSVAMVKNTEAAENYTLGSACAKQVNGPVFQLLHHFGYTTFDYTHGKDINSTSFPTRPSSSDPVIDGILLGNLTVGSSEEDVPEESTRSMMYS